MLHALFEKVTKLSPRRLTAVTLAAAAASAVTAAALFPVMTSGVQRYRDIVVGEITYADAYKHGDILFSFMTVACFFLAWVLLALLPGGRSSDTDSRPAADAVCNDHLPWGIGAFGAGLLMFRSGLPWKEGLSLLIFLAVYAAGRFTARTEGDGVSGKGAADVGCAAPVETAIMWAVSVWGIFFSTIGVLAFVRFSVPALFAGREAAISAIPLYAAVTGGAGLLLLIRSSALLRRSIAVWSQLLMPLLLIAFFCRFMVHNGVVSGNMLPLQNRLAGLVIALGGVVLNVRGMLLRRSGPDSGSYLLVPSIVAAASFLAYVPPVFKQIDFFHTGELLLAWQQIFEYGQMPYSGFAWARGFSDAFSGLLAQLFFDGTFATFDMGFNMTGMLISGVAAYLLCRRAGPLWGLLLSMLGAQSVIFKWWLFLPILLVLAGPGLLRRPLRWLSVWLVLSVVHCLFQATSGIALTLGSLPAAAWMAFLAWRNGELTREWQQRRNPVLMTALALAVFCCATAPLLAGLVTYLRDQGVVNEIANGTVLSRATRIPEWFRWKSKPVWEFFRVGGWMVGIALMWHFLVKELSAYAREKRPESAAVIVVAVTAICSVAAFIPYSMGRIDSAGLSRTGSLSVFIAAILMPLVLRMSGRTGGRSGALLCGFLLGVSLVPFQIDPSEIAKRALVPAEAAPEMVWFNGAENGLPKVGNTYIHSEQVPMITGFKQVSDAMLKPGETFYDLTNFLAFYHFLDRKVTSLYAGYYIVTSEDLQNKVIAALEKSPPPLVLAAPAREFGSGPASLRSYRVYRWFIRKGYIPFVYQGTGYLVSGDRYRQLQIPLPEEAVVNADLAGMFAHDSLGLIPAAWGRSLDTLSERFETVPTADPTLTAIANAAVAGPDGKTVSGLTNCRITGGLDGSRADFMVLRIKGADASAPIPARLHWAGSGRMDNVLDFLAVPGVPLLVPVGSHPAWLRSSRIEQFNIELAGTAAVERVGFLHLKK